MVNRTLLSVNGLTVRAGQKYLVRDVSFELGYGEVLGLFGDSGSGKTTILHTLFGLQNPGFSVEGSVRFLDQEMQDVPAETRSQLGMSIVLQDLGLFSDRSVYENVAYPLRRRNANRTEVASRVHEILSLLRIEELSSRRMNQISGGQRQRVALARSLVYQPRLLLLDEALRGLQEDLRFQFLAFLRKSLAPETSLILVTHEKSELQLLSQQVLTLTEGVIVGKELVTDRGGFDGLGTSFLIPVSGSKNGYLRVTNLALTAPARVSDKLRRNTIKVSVSVWRMVSRVRAAALVEYDNGEPGWLVFDFFDGLPPELPVGSVEVEYDLVGEV